MLALYTIVYDNPLERDPKLLSHFLKYYHKIGVTKFVIAVIYYGDNQTQIVDYVRYHCQGYDCLIFPLKKSIIGSHKDDIEHFLKAKFPIGPDEYVIYADMDDFFEYPAPISEIIDQMNQKDIWCICSNFNDRISTDGTLKQIKSDIDLGEQFPLGGNITKEIIKTITQKVILQRGRVVLTNSGHHNTIVGKLDRYPIGNKSEYIAHHFKWHKGLLKQIEHRLKHGFSHHWYRSEQSRFLDYYNSHNKKFDLNDKKLNIQHYGKLRYFS